MPTTYVNDPANRWLFHNLHTGWTFDQPLVAYWEADCDTISGAYTPAEMGAGELFDEWVHTMAGEHPDHMIPITWYVSCPPIHEFMPFQYLHFEPSSGDFLKYFSWPVNADTQEQLEWLKLPVADKLWGGKRADKGGFIQQFTGWKPAILQPFVYLPSLTMGRRFQ